MLKIETFTGAGFAENAYLVWRDGAREAVVVDPGADASAMIAAIDANQLDIDAILLTHAHIDHIEGVSALKAHTSAPIYMHPDDSQFYVNAHLQAAQFGMRVDP